MRRRMTQYRDVFLRATGQELYPGTLNVVVGREVVVKEDFRILGSDIDEPNQDLVFERCLIDGKPAFRIRPLDALGKGGHGDQVLEITCSQQLPNDHGTEVVVEFFRE